VCDSISILFLGIVPKVMGVFGVQALVQFCTLASTEITILKLIYIFHFSRISQANEYFISTILTICNTLFVLIMLLVRLASGEILSSNFVTSSAPHAKTFLDRSVNFW
jgi:hypothetical protein